MSILSARAIAQGSNEEAFALLSNESVSRLFGLIGSEFLIAIRKLPVGLRAVVATYQLDVPLSFDDFGWHFGDWHDLDLAEETALGLEEPHATELAALFREALHHAKEHWTKLGS